MTQASLNGSPALDGSGEIVGICDTGLDVGSTSPAHPDFAGRVKWVKSYPITPDFAPYINNPGADDGAADLDSGHGTHVAGSAVGDGAASAALPGRAPIRSMAYGARLVFQAVEQALDWKSQANLQRYGRYLLAGIPADITTIFADAYAKGARVHSNSWGGGEPGVYDGQCRQLDQFVWDHPAMCIVVAAGNDGTDADSDGQINLGSVTSPGTAKNCITVGACENLRHNFDGETYGGWWPRDYPAAPYHVAPMADDPDQVVAFSSRGPTADGRIKPDVLAPGTWILSTKSTMLSPTATGWGPFPDSPRYFYMGGTSMATPLTSGAVAALRQHLRRNHGIANPTAALLKAVLIAGADRLPGTAPAGTVVDPHQGFGRIDLAAVAKPPAGVTLLPGAEAAGRHRAEPPDDDLGDQFGCAAAHRARVLGLPGSEPGQQPEPHRHRAGRDSVGRQPGAGWCCAGHNQQRRGRARRRARHRCVDRRCGRLERAARPAALRPRRHRSPDLAPYFSRRVA